MDIYEQAGHILNKHLNHKKSVKALCLKNCVAKKRQTFALVNETLRYCKIIDKIIKNANLTDNKFSSFYKKRKYISCLLRVLVYEVVFGKGIQNPIGIARTIHRRRNEIKYMYEKYKKDPDFMPENQNELSDEKEPINVRINFLLENRKRENFIQKLQGKPNEIFEDLFTLSANKSQSIRRLVKEGKLVIQSCPSCLPAHCIFDAIGDFTNAIDACASPGNKTAHLCALHARRSSLKMVEKKLCLIAIEKDCERYETLRTRVRQLGASESVTCLKGDFLNFHWSSAEVILCDPSCSANRQVEIQRLIGLASFQIRLLVHALFDFPRARCVSYSTCSANSIENELVVSMALEISHSLGWKLHNSVPSWQFRGETLDVDLWKEYAPKCFPKERLDAGKEIPLAPTIFEKASAAYCLRNLGSHPFFVAVFVRK